MFYLVGLGNPGEEYRNSRHNTGRMALEHFRKINDLPDFEFDKKSKSLISKGKVGDESVTLLAPETFMNKSGSAVSFFIKPKTGKNKSLENLVVIYDDIDLPIGTTKISYNRGSGGHRGLESIVRAVKTKEFVRIRIGITPSTPKGKVKKPDGEKKVLDFILSSFKPNEMEVMKKAFKKSSEALSTIITDSRDKAMNLFN